MDLSYLNILNIYSNLIPFSRLDVLGYYQGLRNLTDIKDSTHNISRIYRSYNTYRKNIAGEDLLLKQYDTYNIIDDIENNFYDPSLFLYKYENPSVNYTFSGSVLSPKYPTNGQEMSLEDLFSTFYYDYIKALDTSYIINSSDHLPYYFNNTTLDNASEQESGLYNILPIGTEYNDEEHGIIKIEYDGSYIPNIEELLSGNLYIVIQSPGMPPRKINFNNKMLPTLFINDDHYILTDSYIMNDKLLLKLCDVKLFEKFACSISWYKLFKITNIYNLFPIINNETIIRYAANIEDKHINDIINNTLFRLYYLVYYKNTLNNNEINIYSSSNIISIGTNTFAFEDGLTPNIQTIVEDSGDYNLIPIYNNIDRFINKSGDTKISNIKHLITSANTELFVILNIKFGLTVILKGFALSPPEPEYQTTYTFNWWKNNQTS